jgi:hypothetical protein
MIYSLFTSKKAQHVTQTEVGLSRQDEGDEMFGSSQMARTLVHSANSFESFIIRILPEPIRNWIDSRFNKNDIILADGAAYDLIRASVNLVLAGSLIIMGTSLKLPLSTTYVTFMVAMGTSLADRAWGRESAVFPYHRNAFCHRRMVYHSRESLSPLAPLLSSSSSTADRLSPKL